MPPERTVSNWGSMRTRESNDEHFSFHEKMKSECESCLQDLSVERNSIGSIFNLKARHDWVERSATTIEEYQAIEARQTAEQIRERYKDAEKPKLPELD